MFDQCFDTYPGGQAWARLAWSRARDQDPDLDSSTGQLPDLVRLISLAALTRENYAYRFEEGSVGDWVYLDLLGPVEAAGLQNDIAPDAKKLEEQEDLPTEFLLEVLVGMVQKSSTVVAGRLRTAFSDSDLFAMLEASADSEGSYPWTRKQWRRPWPWRLLTG